MEDQIHKRAKLGISPIQLGVKNDSDVIYGSCRVFSVAWNLGVGVNDKWQNLPFTSTLYQENRIGMDAH